MLDISNYQSRARSITLEKCVVFLSDTNKFNNLKIELHHQHELHISVQEDAIHLQRQKYEQPIPPVVFIHASNLIGRTIHLNHCDLIASLNLYQLNLKLENSQTKLFGKCNYLRKKQDKLSVFDDSDFLCLEDISQNNKKCNNITLNEMYFDFISFHCNRLDISQEDKKYYKELLKNIH